MSNLKWKSPFEVLHGKALDCSTLRTIGCLYYAANVGEKDKVEIRAIKCVFLRYTTRCKDTNLMICKAKKIS